MRRSVSSTKKKSGFHFLFFFVSSVMFSGTNLRGFLIVPQMSQLIHRFSSNGTAHQEPLLPHCFSATYFRISTPNLAENSMAFFFFMVLSSNFLIVPFRCHDCRQCPLVVTDMVHIFGIFLVADLHIKKHDQKMRNSFFANFVVVVYC